MKIEFDPVKDAANIAKHGVTLAMAERLDLGAAAVVPDERRDYGEARYRAFGRIDGVPYCLVLTFRAETIRVISLRRAHEEEMDRHGVKPRARRRQSRMDG